MCQPTFLRATGFSRAHHALAAFRVVTAGRGLQANRVGRTTGVDGAPALDEASQAAPTLNELPQGGRAGAAASADAPLAGGWRPRLDVSCIRKLYTSFEHTAVAHEAAR